MLRLSGLSQRCSAFVLNRAMSAVLSHFKIWSLVCRNRRADPRQPSARLQMSQPHAWSRSRRNLGRPGGLRAGSPPSPPPRSIRPTVRRLLRSPRLSGPGPHQIWQFWLFRLWRQGRVHICDRLKFCQKLWPMLYQVPHDPGVPEQLSQVRFDNGELQMVLAVGVLN